MRRYPLLKIPTVADPAHVSDVMSVLRFIHVTNPILSSPIIHSQAEETNDRVTLAFCLFILNISVEKLSLSTTKSPFQEETWPSPSHFTIYDSEQC